MKLSETQRKVLSSLVSGDILLLARGTKGRVILWPSATVVPYAVLESLRGQDRVQLKEVLTIGLVYDITPAGREALGDE